VAGKKYLVRTARLRAPTKTTATDKLWRFAGDTLAIDGSDVAFLTSEKIIKYYLGDMRWHTGGITSWNQTQINIQGNISVDTGAGADVFTITGRNQTFDIWSSVTGEEGRARIKIISENGGKHKVPGDNFGRTTVCFRGDTSQLHAAITLTTNTTLSAAGALPATITAPPSGEVMSAAAASYNAVTLQSGASLIVSGTNTLTVGNLTLNTGSHLVWEMSGDNSLGKLIVTGTGSKVPGTIVLRIRR